MHVYFGHPVRVLRRSSTFGHLITFVMSSGFTVIPLVSSLIEIFVPQVYSAEWNNEETNPHKPVRTNYLVGSLPGGRHVEVEAIVVLPPKEF